MDDVMAQLEALYPSSGWRYRLRALRMLPRNWWFAWRNTTLGPLAAACEACADARAHLSKPKERNQ